MKYRELGMTGMLVSEIGFGTWGIGGLTEGATSYGKTDDVKSLDALSFAFDKGINFFDTANIYGNGHSEELLGKAFQKYRDKVFIATKFGFTRHNGPHDISPSYIRQCLEESLRRLKSDYVDIYQFHSTPPSLVRFECECLEVLQSLKREGKIRAIGYSVKNPIESFFAIKEFGVDVVQVTFNMIDRRALHDGVFDLVRKCQAGIIIRIPFCFGFLTGSVLNTQFDLNDHRSTWSQEQLIRWKEAPKLFSVVGPKGIYTSAQLALKFCLSFSEVSTVIPGMLTRQEVEENARASDLPLLSIEQLELIERINLENKFFR